MEQCLHHLMMLQNDAKMTGPRHVFFHTAKELYSFVRPTMPINDLAGIIKLISRAWPMEITPTLMTRDRTHYDFFTGSLKACNFLPTECTPKKIESTIMYQAKFYRELESQTLSDFDHRIQQILPRPNQRKHNTRTNPNEKRSKVLRC